jgi:hypothetical protein
VEIQPESLRSVSQALQELREPDTPETDRWLKSIAKDLSSSGNSNGAEIKAKKVGRLSFFGIGEGGPPDASERVDEFVGLAIDSAHPSS